LSPEGLFHEKSLSPQKIWGQQGDKREKVKKLKYLFTISYRLSLFTASENNHEQSSGYPTLMVPFAFKKYFESGEYDAYTVIKDYLITAQSGARGLSEDKVLYYKPGRNHLCRL